MLIMESIHKLGELLEEASTLFKTINIPNQINSLLTENTKLKDEMKELIETYQNKCDELIQMKNKYDRDIGLKTKEIKEQKEELTRLTKISLIHQYDKQLKDKTDYIKILEHQLEIYKNASTLKSQSPKVIQVEKIELNETVVPTILEKSINNLVDNKKLKKKKSKKNNEQENNEPENNEPENNEQENNEPENNEQENNEQEKPKKKKGKKVNEEQEFNPEDFEDVNGYELIVYKSVHYLRDLETNEIYNIKANKPSQVVGLINSNGRVKFR